MPRLGALAVFLAVPMLLFAAMLGAATASAACPNEVFRTGPSAKLPECRAYELVTPRYTNGIVPTGGHGPIGEEPNAGDFILVSPKGGDVMYNTDAGTFGGYPGNGSVDRYRSRRTADGWVNELVSLHGDQAGTFSRPAAASPDHNYFFQSAENPSASPWAPWAGLSRPNLLRTPSGFEPLGRGSLGDDATSAYTMGRMITENATHVFFVSDQHLEPLAAPVGTPTIYDRTPGGPTKVVSLLPGDQPTSLAANWLGATRDGSEVAFGLGVEGGSAPLFVRQGDTTREAVRPVGALVGKELECTGEPAGATIAYQWLREGAPIGGATTSTYTLTAADEGTVVQCQVTASTAEGTSLRTSLTRLVEPYQETDTPELRLGEGIGISPSGGVTPGTQLTCGSGFDFHVSGATYTYAWLREGIVIGGATASTYTPVEVDIDKSIQCRKTATTGSGVAVAYSSPVAVTPDFPRASAAPAIANATDPGDAPEAGDELSCSSGTWSGSPSFSYQWIRNGAAIGSANTSSYTVAAADEGKVLECLVTAENSAATVPAASGPVTVDPQPGTAPPEMTFPYGVFGGSTVGSNLFCGQGGWSGGPTISRQWLRDGAPIPGATGSSYTLSPADVGAVVQCRLTATNAGGTVVALDADEGVRYVSRAVPAAEARLPTPAIQYAGIFNGHLFYTDRYTSPFSGEYTSLPGDLYSFDLDTGRSTRITDTGDAAFVNVSEDGSHVYFARTFESGGVKSGKLYVWDRADGSTTLIAEISGEDLDAYAPVGAGLTTWVRAVGPEKTHLVGPLLNHTRSTPDGTVLAFEATTQLTAFDNTEATPETCTKPEEKDEALERCLEVYRYDAESEQLSCVSCDPGDGPATGEAQLVHYNKSYLSSDFDLLSVLTLTNNLSTDGSSLVFESTGALLPRDVNHKRDVYRWKPGEGLALISTGQNANTSALFGASRNGDDIVFGTREQLLPEDENGSGIRLYDARVDGGFPPPEETVTEPCAGDVCQGAPSAAPAPPRVASSSLNGTGNVRSKLHCGKGKRRVIRHGRERCVKRRHHKRHHHRRAGRNRRAAR